MFTSKNMNTAGDKESSTDTYLGPESDFDSMEAGCSIEDLGELLKFLTIMFETRNTISSLSSPMISLASLIKK
jgi:hypothetical protein